MALPSYLTLSWIGITALTPLSALLIAWTLVFIHRKRSKSILLLALIYSQLIFQFINFGVSTLTLLKFEGPYIPYLALAFNAILLFKSFALLSLHLEEFYKLKSPSNYLLNINSSLLKYHLLVVVLLSLMGTYFLRGEDFVPTFGLSDRFLVGAYLTFHASILLLSLFFLGLKILLVRNSVHLTVVIGTNSTSSSANLFGLDGCASNGGIHGIAASTVATLNLLINATLVVCTFWLLWLPFIWSLSNLILWTQVLESIFTPFVYWIARRTNESQKNSERYQNHLQSSRTESNNRFPDGSLCFNNGEFTYFAGGKNNSETVLNNAMSSEYNTFDSFHQARSYSDSFRCASVTTIANDDFEFLSRGQGLSHQNYKFETIQKELATRQNVLTQNQERSGTLRKSREFVETSTTSLSMNDLDLIDSETEPTASSDSANATAEQKYKYKKKSHRIKKRFTNKSLTRRVLSLESLHSHVNESHLAYLDTGERVIVFTTDFI